MKLVVTKAILVPVVPIVVKIVVLLILTSISAGNVKLNVKNDKGITLALDHYKTLTKICVRVCISAWISVFKMFYEYDFLVDPRALKIENYFWQYVLRDLFYFPNCFY